MLQDLFFSKVWEDGAANLRHGTKEETTGFFGAFGLFP